MVHRSLHFNRVSQATLPMKVASLKNSRSDTYNNHMSHADIAVTVLKENDINKAILVDVI